MMIAKIFIITLFISFQVSAVAKNVNDEQFKLTEKQVRALQSLNTTQDEESSNAHNNAYKNIRLTVSKLKDNQGNVYLGAEVSRAELSNYLFKLAQLLGDDFKKYRDLQATRDHQLFHMTLLSPPEYQLVDKALVEKLLSSGESLQLNVSLLGLGKVERDNKKTFFVVAQSDDGQLFRQRFSLKNKHFHITLGFSPSDIYGVTKDNSTLIQ
jgi:virulence-associated protein VapD